jgi:DNA invertase Pin-like site-specific DNA recombinase
LVKIDFIDMKVFFYSRISTVTQNSSRQIANFKSHPQYKPEYVFVDKVQGNVPFLERPEAGRLFNIVTSKEYKEDNITIVVDSIDRLGRNLVTTLQTIELFTHNKINLQSLKEGFETLIDGKENPIAKVVVSVMASIAEMERDRIKERTQEGIKIARAQGKFKGRKIGSVQSDERLLQRHPIVVEKLKKGLTIRDISSITQKSTATIMRVKKTMIKRSLIAPLANG